MIALENYPFKNLRLPVGESAVWKAHNPTFHRSGDYGIVLSEQALYLRSYSPFWLPYARWRRIPLSEVRSIVLKDSRIWPSLRVKTARRVEVLRTPSDYE